MEWFQRLVTKAKQIGFVSIEEKQIEFESIPFWCKQVNSDKQDCCFSHKVGIPQHPATLQPIAVYDPSAGFVTGAGKIYSTACSFVDDPTIEEYAIFAFVSKYTNGTTTSTGNTKFMFKVADFTFDSEFYDC